MSKTAAYGISTVKLAAPVAGGFPASFDGSSAFVFKAIVKDSVKFNDQAPSDNDIEIEEDDNIYATLESSKGSKGFTMDTYDLSKEAYATLLNYTYDASTGWNTEPGISNKLIKAVQIVTRDFDEFPSKTFEWARMAITVTKAGTIGKSGFPNLSLTFKQLSNMDTSGKVVSGARWKLTADKGTGHTG